MKRQWIIKRQLQATADGQKRWDPHPLQGITEDELLEWLGLVPSDQR